MTRDDINKYAYAEVKPDSVLTCPDWLLWFRLRDVYRKYRSGDISMDQGEKEKRMAVKQYELDNGALIGAEKILQRNANMWAEIELAASAYMMDRTIENADRFIDAVYGVKHKNAQKDAHSGVQSKT